MITQIFDLNSIKILTMFSISPGSKFNRNEIKEKTALNNVPLDVTLNRLLSTKIIKREKNYYMFNFENDLTLNVLETIQKEFKRLKNLPLNIYFIILDLIDFFSTKKEIELFLFGSYSKLIYSEKSDIDIALIYQKELDINEINKIIGKIEQLYKKKVEIHTFEKNSFYKNKNDILIKSILKDGIKLI